VSELDFNALCELVRESYCQHVRAFYASQNVFDYQTYGDRELPQYDGGTTRAGRNYKPLWPKLAKLILDKQLDVRDYVRATFRSWEGQKHPAPNYLLSAAAMERYEDYKSTHPLGRGTEVARELKINADLATTRIEMVKVMQNVDEHQAQIKTILDPFTELSALFRLCMAVNGGHDNLVPELVNEALAQYISNRDAYDDTWESFIPDLLRQRADDLGRQAR
jgi:hypothetical protein